MKLYYLAIAFLITALLSTIFFDFLNKKQHQKAINSTFALSKFYYMAIDSNFYEPNPYSKSLSRAKNRAYPLMPKINRLEFIYE